jgi:glycosyltransferase involved in cell wall biosynthesis
MSVAEQSTEIALHNVLNSIPFQHPISVILPAYNESDIIEEVVISYYKEIGSKLKIDLVIAEDGSIDGTREKLLSLKERIPMLLLSDHNRKGYAKGVADALRSCHSTWIFFSDSDGQYLPGDFWPLWQKRHGNDLIIGRKINRREGMYRIVLNKGFHFILNLLFGYDLHDSDCGFRLIRREAVSAVINDVKYLKYSFWSEFTVRCCSRGFRMSEIPINHNPRKHGNSHIYTPSRLPMIILRQFRGLALLYAEKRKKRL